MKKMRKVTKMEDGALKMETWEGVGGNSAFDDRVTCVFVILSDLSFCFFCFFKLRSFLSVLFFF